MNTNEVLNWVKNFKYSWLPDNITNDTQLIALISNKLYELEQLLIRKYSFPGKKNILYLFFCLIENTPDENEITIENETPALLTPIDNHQQTDEENETFSRPIIRIKRITLTEAERYAPPGWKTRKDIKKFFSNNQFSFFFLAKSKGGGRRKKGRKKPSITSPIQKRNKKTTSTIPNESMS